MSQQHPISDGELPPVEEKPKAKDKIGFEAKPLLYTETLYEIFGFSELDLNTNRNGMSTAAQKQDLQDELKDDADGMWLLLTALLGVTLLLAFIMMMSGIPTIYLVIGAGVVLGPLLLYAYLRQNKSRQDLDNLRVRSLEGPAQVQYRRFSDGGGYTLRVADEHFPITMAQARALDEYRLGSLRVHFAPNSKQIFSAETAYDAELDKLKNNDLDELPLLEDEAVTTNRQYK